MKICRTCFAYVPAARFVCPYCKVEFPTPPPQAQPKETAETLIKRSLDPEDLKRQFYEKMVALARSKGYKPGFAAAKFKDHYGSWPARSWSDETQGKFAGDLSWQTMLERREEMKGEKNGEKKTETQAEMNNETDEPSDSIEAPFSDWLNEHEI